MRKERVLIIGLIVASCLSACGKKADKPVVESAAVQTESTATQTESIPKVTTGQTESEESTKNDVGNISEIAIGKETDESKASTLTEEEQASVLDKLRTAMETEYNSYSYSASLTDISVETEKSNYSATRFRQDTDVEGKRDKKYSYTHTSDSKSYGGNENLSDIELYLFDKGGATYSYSKKKESTEWLGAKVQRDLEIEPIIFKWLEADLSLDGAVVISDNNGGYNIDGTVSLAFALNNSGVDLEHKKVDMSNPLVNQLRVPITVSIDKNSEIYNIHYEYRGQLQSYYDTAYNQNESSSNMMGSRGGEYDMKFSGYNTDIKLDVPEQIQRKLNELE